MYNFRRSSKLLRRMVCSKGYEYRAVAYFMSHKSVHYDQNRIYATNLTRCYSVGCYQVIPVSPSSYKVSSNNFKIKSYLYALGPSAKRCNDCASLSCCQPSILGLSIKNAFNRLCGELTEPCAAADINHRIRYCLSSCRSCSL